MALAALFVFDTIDRILCRRMPTLEGCGQQIDGEHDDNGEQQWHQFHFDGQTGDAAHHRGEPIGKWYGYHHGDERLDYNSKKQTQGDATDFCPKDTAEGNLAPSLADEITVHGHQAEHSNQQGNSRKYRQHTEEPLVTLIPVLVTLGEQVNISCLMTRHCANLPFDGVLHLLAHSR